MNKNGNITKIMKSKEEKKTQKKIDEARNNSKNKRGKESSASEIPVESLKIFERELVYKDGIFNHIY